MREGIHPEYPPAAVSCACGNSFVTRSTRGDFSIDVCAACHPFYTGTQKLMDTAGRVDRFRKRYGDAKPADTKVAGAAAQAKSEAVEKTAKEKKPKKAAAAPAEAPAADALAADAPAADAPAAESTES